MGSCLKEDTKPLKFWNQICWADEDKVLVVVKCVAEKEQLRIQASVMVWACMANSHRTLSLLGIDEFYTL